MKKLLPLLLFALVFLPSSLTRAADAPANAPALYKVGDAIEAFSVKDQHEKPFAFAPGPQRLIVSYTMGVGKAANAFFAKQPASFLEDQKTLFLSDIHGMPGVGRVFALPKMKKYPHRILLGDDDHLLDRHPKEKDRLTVFELDPSGKITAIKHIDPEKDLPGLFAAPAAK
jgi:hypothetical protein